MKKKASVEVNEAETFESYNEKLQKKYGDNWPGKGNYRTRVLRLIADAITIQIYEAGAKNYVKRKCINYNYHSNS